MMMLWSSHGWGSCTIGLQMATRRWIARYAPAEIHQAEMTRSLPKWMLRWYGSVVWLSQKLRKRWTLELFRHIQFWPKIWRCRAWRRNPCRCCWRRGKINFELKSHSTCWTPQTDTPTSWHHNHRWLVLGVRVRTENQNPVVIFLTMKIRREHYTPHSNPACHQLTLLTVGKNPRMRIKVQGRLMQVRLIEIHQVFAKKCRIHF